jgi:hypothetical protein
LRRNAEHGNKTNLNTAGVLDVTVADVAIAFVAELAFAATVVVALGAAFVVVVVVDVEGWLGCFAAVGAAPEEGNER